MSCAGNPLPPSAENLEPQQSKKTAKKDEVKQEKLRRRQETEAASAAAALEEESVDPLSGSYGDLNFRYIQSKVSAGRQWTAVMSLSEDMKDKEVLFRGRAHVIRGVSKKMAFVVVRESRDQGCCTLQCVLSVAPGKVSQQMVKFATTLTRESIIVVDGVVAVPNAPIKGTSQQVEVQVRRIYCIQWAVPTLPINIEDAARSELEIENALQAGEQLVRVNQDTRLNYRVLELRTPANYAISHLKCEVQFEFMRFLKGEGFVGIQTPKLISGASEGGASVFKFDYMGQPACLSQSPQLHKQMTICADKWRVFEIGPVFRAERSNTHRHLCEFTGLDAEMEIIDHYSEVMDIVDHLFVSIFDHLNENCKKELGAINKQYPFEPLKYLRTTLRLSFQEGMEMLKAAGVEVDPLGDLSTETERKLGQLVLEKYGTEFFMLYRYPLAVRPFYTMPCYDDNLYSNSFDVFIRGEEIISGAQCVHEPDLLIQRAEAYGIDLQTISAYIDAFRYVVPPHGGFGAGLERVVMLFCGLDNIRKVSLYPRDPRRITPCHILLHTSTSVLRYRSVYLLVCKAISSNFLSFLSIV